MPLSLLDCSWTERQGRSFDDTAFHEWTYQHASGRILAAVIGPPDKRGGFTHHINFLFAQDITMLCGPFVYTDFDSAKRFVESVVGSKLVSISPEGELEIVKVPDPLSSAMKDGMANALEMFQKGKGLLAGSPGTTEADNPA